MAQGSRRGFFRNVVEAIVAARQRQANRYVANALLTLDDSTLKAYGYDRDTLRRGSVRDY